MNRVCLILALLLWASPGWANEQRTSGFYVVFEQQDVGLHYFDSPAFPMLGYISAKPDFALSQLESVSSLETCHNSWTIHHEDGSTESGDDEHQCLNIELPKGQAKAFEDLTRHYIGHRLLLVLDGEAIVAPNIREPIEGGTVLLNLPDSADGQRIKRQLDEMLAAQ